MSLPARMVLLVLADHHNQQTGRLDPSVERIAMCGAISDRAVRGALRELEQLKIIATVHRTLRTGLGKRNLTNRYRLLGGEQYAAGMGNNMQTNLKDTPHSKKPKPAAFDDLVLMIENPSDFNAPNDPEPDLD